LTMCSQLSIPAHNQNGVFTLCDSEFGSYHHARAGAAKLFRPFARYALHLSLRSSGTEYSHEGCGFVDALHRREFLSLAVGDCGV
jgi:hypothetical protein